MVEKRRSDGPSTGLVIDTNIDLSEPYAALVLDLDELLETGRAKIRKLSSDAFRDPANLEGEEEAQKKYERLREKTLNFGSHISWRKKDVDSTTEFIGKFENINPLLETRVLHGIGQILLDGAINPAKQDKIYTKYFGNVVIPSFLIHKASPNVFFEAWISCRFNKETSIFEHQLHSYNKICSYSKQTDIIHLPWNQGYSVEFLCSLAGDSDDEFEGITFKDGGRSDSKSEKKTAFCTGDGIFLLENSPMTKCIFPIKHDRTIIFGALYEVECFWNRVEECYIVLDLLKVYEKDLWMPVYKPNSSLFAEVHAHPTFRGIYESKIFGLLDDPFGSLALFHLGQFANTHIPVTVLDRNPSRHGQIRFSITSLARRDMDSSSILGLNNEIRVVDVDGVVVEGGVVSAEHSPIVFHFRADETSLPSPGTQVTFEALYDKRMDVFNITEWHLNKTRSKLPVGRETFSYAGSVSEEQTVYKATVRLVTIKGDAEMLYCEEFGLIDDCLNRVVLQENINNYAVWIKATIAQEGYEYPARTPYHIVAVDDEILAQEEPSNQETPILGPTTPIDACAPEIF